MCTGDQDRELSEMSRLAQDDGSGQAVLEVMRDSGTEQEEALPSTTQRTIIPPVLPPIPPTPPLPPSAGQTATPQRQLPGPAVDPLPSIKTASSREDAPGLVTVPAAQESLDTVPPPGSNTSQPPPNMLFTEFCKSPRSTIRKFRHSLPQPLPVPSEFDADLVSRDKAKQKEAVKRYLEEKIRSDWDFVWPPASASSPPSAPVRGIVESAPGENCAQTTNADKDLGARPADDESDSDESDAESVYSTVSEDPSHYCIRAEWASDLSDDEDGPSAGASPFRFESPDAVGTVVQSSINAGKARRRRAEREETSWNEGLACFVARRDAWTGAKTVRIKPKAPTPVSVSPTRRILWRHRTESSTSSSGQATSVRSSSPVTPSVVSALSPTSTRASQQTDATSVSQSPSEERCRSSRQLHASYPVETRLPIPPPLLPPQNPMRAAVTPHIYPSLYDKIIVHGLQPSCPVNLSDMLRACVVGWKRDGEWPPRPAPVPLSTTAELVGVRRRKSNATAQDNQSKRLSTVTTASARRLSMTFGFLSGRTEDKEKEGRDTKEGKQTNSDSGDTGKSIRKSIQKMFSLGSGHASGGSGGNPAVVETAAAK